MRKILANLLISLANQINPPCKEEVFEEKVGYEMKVCACAISVDKKYIRKMMKNEHISSRRKAIEIVRKRELEEAKRSVLTTIEKKILETRTYLKDGFPIVEAKVNCYVAKEK